MQFLVNEPALLIEKTLIIGDLHLGLEKELERKGFNIPDQTNKILIKIKKLVRQNNCKKLIILGDIKHEITGIGKEETDFINELKKIVEVKIVKGNHDGLLGKIFKVIPAAGFYWKNFYFLHGHALPGKKAFKKTIIMSHLHPIIEFNDPLGGRISEKIWVVSETKKGEKIIIVPAFNDWIGGIDIRKCSNFPLKKHIKFKESKVYLLDGLYLGRIKELKK